MSYEITELSQAVEGLQKDEAIGSHYFASCAEFIGQSLAEKMISTLELAAHETVRVVCSAEDYDMLAIPFVAALGNAGIAAAISCLWSIYEEATDFLPARSVLVSQAHVDGPAAVGTLVAICSSLSEPATVADHFSRASAATQANRHLVISPFDEIDLVLEVRNELDLRGAISPEFINLLAEVPEIPHFSLLQKVRHHLDRVHGRHGVGVLPRDFGGASPRFDNDYEPNKYGL